MADKTSHDNKIIDKMPIFKLWRGSKLYDISYFIIKIGLCYSGHSPGSMFVPS
jgi:hypothetical protein